MKIKITYPDGVSRHTENVELSNATTHVAAHDRWSDEAELLLQAEYDDGPAQVDGWRVIEDDGDYVVYESI